MKYIFILTSLTTIAVNFAHGQTYYRGLERMCWTNPNGKVECYDEPRNWYHENTVLIDQDSIFMYKTPLKIVNGRKLYSTSDGAFFYYYGVIKNINFKKYAYLTSYNCDYCGKMVGNDSVTGHQVIIPYLDTLEFQFAGNKIKIGKVLYDKLKIKKTDYFPSKYLFYLYSN